MKSTRSFRSNSMLTSKPVVLQKALEPDFDHIRNQYKQISESFEGINFQEDNTIGWTQLARDFVFLGENQRASKFIRRIQELKVKAEKELKEKIERRVFFMRENRLTELIGRDIAKKIKKYIQIFTEEQQEFNNSQFGRRSIMAI